MPYPSKAYGKPCQASQLVQVKLDFGKAGGGVHTVTWNKYAVYPLLRAVNEIRRYNEKFPKKAYRVGKYGFQTYSCRDVTGGTTPSIHSWALAADVNPWENPYSKYGDKMNYAVKPYFIKAFKKHGFVWGGDWSSPKDYMHFQYFRKGKAWKGDYIGSVDSKPKKKPKPKSKPKTTAKKSTAKKSPAKRKTTAHKAVKRKTTAKRKTAKRR